MSQNNLDLESQIRGFLSENILFDGEGIVYNNDASLLEAGVMDSLGVMELVTFVSKSYGIIVPLEDISPVNFDSVNRLAAYVRRRRGSGPP